MFGRKKTKAWYWYALGPLLISLIMYRVAGIFQSAAGRESKVPGVPKRKRAKEDKPTLFERFLPR